MGGYAVPLGPSEMACPWGCDERLYRVPGVEYGLAAACNDGDKRPRLVCPLCRRPVGVVLTPRGSTNTAEQT